MLNGIAVQQFYGCCGIYTVANHISVFKTGVPLTPMQKDSIKQDLLERIKTYKTTIGIVLLALNHKQVETGMGQVFEEVGFKILMKDVLHAGTKSRLTLYGLDLHEERDRVEKECRFKGFA